MRLTRTDPGQPTTSRVHRPPSRRAGLALAVGVVTLLATQAPTAGVWAAPQACNLEQATIAWLQKGLDSWQEASTSMLGLELRPLPWMMMIGSSCTWHLEPDPQVREGLEPVSTSLGFGGRPVDVRMEPHEGTVVLPNGAELPAGIIATTSLYGDDWTPFFVAALPEVWRADPRTEQLPDVDAFVLGVLVHELVHTRHLPAVARRIEALQARHPTLPEDMNDDVIQTRFGKRPGFAQAVATERELLHRAAEEPDDDRARALLADALARIRERQRREFTGSDAPYAEIEELFLSLEGAAIWTHGKLSEDDPDIAFRRGNDTEWVQDEGYALFLALDRFVKGWPQRVLGPELASPLALLEEELGTAR